MSFNRHCYLFISYQISTGNMAAICKTKHLLLYDYLVMPPISGNMCISVILRKLFLKISCLTSCESEEAKGKLGRKEKFVVLEKVFFYE